MKVPTLIAYSLNDQYVPKRKTRTTTLRYKSEKRFTRYGFPDVDKHKVTELMRQTMAKAEVALLADDDHAVSRHPDVFVKRVTEFLNKIA